MRVEEEESITVGVCVDLCKGAQGETNTVLRAGETHVPKQRRHHQVLVCGEVAEGGKKTLSWFLKKQSLSQHSCSDLLDSVNGYGLLPEQRIDLIHNVA